MNNRLAFGWRQVILLGVFSALSLSLYLFFSNSVIGIGYPLDDAWIHQTYARNLAASGEWAFFPGELSMGSTAPLWAGLLSLGYVLGINHFAWTFLLGWLILWGTSILSAYMFSALLPERAKYSPWVGVFFAMEWHLVWAASSGMETLLFAFVVLLVFAFLIQTIAVSSKTKKFTVIFVGLLVGSSVWIRPEGITLLAPAGLALLFAFKDYKRKTRAVIFLLAGFAVLFIPYLIFNWRVAGSIWPNTFYAKQAEYAVLRETPFWLRLGQQAALPLVGAGSLLLPGLVLFVFASIKEKAWGRIFILLWLIGFVGLYAVRLPVTYQHGRYMMPVMPIYFLMSFIGMYGWLDISSNKALTRLLSRAWVVSVGLLLVAFLFLGANAYSSDVGVIETEMVAVAKWVDKNVPADAVVAAHDIGALGYFAPRPILDLAGLVSPDVVPFIRDEARIADYLNEHNADYLIAFPDWYSDLTKGLLVIYESGGRFAPTFGQENLVVYRWD